MKNGRVQFPGIMLAFLLLLASTDIRAGMIDESELQPWENCALCHSLDGVSRMPKFPKLAGQSAAYIEKQIRDFRSGRRHNDGGQMEEMASVIAEEKISVVAGYFSRLRLPAAPVAISEKNFESGAKLAQAGDDERQITACNSCHVPGPAAGATVVRITGQHRDYLVKQMTDFKNGDRANDETGVMTSIAEKLTPAEINALGDYFSMQPRK